MAKYEKGILGVKKDPKNLMLFSYSGGEQWPSSDSEDSDYEPSQKEAEQVGLELSPKKKKTKRKSSEGKKSPGTGKSPNKRKSVDSDETKNKKRRSTTSSISSLTDGVGLKDDIWGQHIPPEILLRIFQFVVDSEGALPFLIRASRVCCHWSDTSRQPILWRNLDLSFGWIKSQDQTLQWLCPNRLTRLRSLSLASWKNLTNTGLNAVADHCPLLESINLSNCSKINSEGIKNIMTKCEQVSSLDLSFMGSDAVSPQCLKFVIEKCCSNLKQINLSGNNLKGFNAVLNAIAASCINLEVLDICNAQFSSDFLSFNIERMQQGCPKLKMLRLTNSKFMSPHNSLKMRVESKGFPCMEELSIAVSPDAINTGIGMDDDFLHRLLKSSLGCRLLDLRGSTHLTARGLQALPITDLQHLYLSQSSIAKYDGIEVIIHKWQHSLLELDLSWNVYPGMSLDLAMKKLSDDPSKSKLQTLNLSGTCIAASRLQSILEGCPNLQTLNLGSCRGLPRGMKREFSMEALTQLRKDIHKIVEEEAAANQ